MGQVFSSPRSAAADAVHPISGFGAPVMDWSDQALARTWRTAGVLCLGIGVILHACVSWIPGTIFLLTGVWAVAKGNPQWRMRSKAVLA